MDPRHAIGTRAEQVVADWLVARGCEILARNVRLGHLEVDVVARDGQVAALVEVRTRGAGAYESAFRSVGFTKSTRLLRAADRLWRFHLSRVPGIVRMRIDVAAVTFARDGTPSVAYAKSALVAGDRLL